MNGVDAKQPTPSVNPTDIGFRAAANTSVEASKRPIPSRVLWRVCESKDFKNVLGDIYESLRVQSVPNERDFDSDLERLYRLLPLDSRFATLLLEAIEEDKRWQSLTKEGFDNFWHRIQSFVEKLFSKEHPLSRVLTSVVISGYSLLLTYNVTLRLVPKNAQQYLELPVIARIGTENGRVQVKLDFKTDKEPEPVDVKLSLKTEAEPKPIPVTLDVKPASATVPIRLTAPDPIQVKFLQTHPLQVEEAAKPPSQCNTCTSVTALVDELKSFEKELRFMDASAQGANTALTGLQATTSRSIEEDAKATIPLQWADANNSISTCYLTLSVHNVSSKSVGVQFLALDCPQMSVDKTGDFWSQNGVTMLLNDTTKLPNLPFFMTAAAVEHHVFGKSRTVLRFERDASALSRYLQTKYPFQPIQPGEDLTSSRQKH